MMRYPWSFNCSLFPYNSFNQENTPLSSGSHFRFLCQSVISVHKWHRLPQCRKEEVMSCLENGHRSSAWEHRPQITWFPFQKNNLQEITNEIHGNHSMSSSYMANAKWCFTEPERQSWNKPEKCQTAPKMFVSRQSQNITKFLYRHCTI